MRGRFIKKSEEGGFLAILTFIFLISLVICGLPTEEVLAKEGGNPIELRLATFGPVGQGSISEATQWFVDEVEKRTKGEVKIKIFWSESLAKITEISSAIKSGIADMGTVVGFYEAEPFPYDFGASLNSMVLAGADIGGWIKPYRKLYSEFPEVRNCFNEQNQKLLAFWEYDNVDVISTKPIRNLKEAKGIKIRTSGSVTPKIYKAAGMIPVAIPSTEAYDAASRGMVSAIMATADIASKYRWYEPCKYWIRIPMFGTSLVYFLSINSNTWYKLPANVQKVMVEVGEEFTESYPGRLKKMFQDFEKFYKESGGTFITFSEADQKEWKSKTAKPIFEEYVQKVEKMGRPNARKILERFAELVGYKP